MLRHASDRPLLVGAVIAPFLARVSTVGRPSIHNMRVMQDGIQYQATVGYQWRMLPKDFPPFTTVQHHFYRCRNSGRLFAINEALVVEKLPHRGTERDAECRGHRQPIS